MGGDNAINGTLQKGQGDKGDQSFGRRTCYERDSESTSQCEQGKTKAKGVSLAVEKDICRVTRRRALRQYGLSESWNSMDVVLECGLPHRETHMRMDISLPRVPLRRP